MQQCPWKVAAGGPHADLRVESSLRAAAPSEEGRPGFWNQASRVVPEAGTARPFLCGRFSLPIGTRFLKKEEEGLKKKKSCFCKMRSQE